MIGYLKSASVIGASLMLLLAADRSAAAQNRSQRAQSLILRDTVTDSGYYGAQGLYAPAGINVAVGKLTQIKCTSQSGSCTIEGDMWIQSGKEEITRNQYGLCLAVDGNLAPNCQDVGSTPSDGTYAVGSTSQQVNSVPVGYHTVQGYFQSAEGAYLFNYTFNYHIYDVQ